MNTSERYYFFLRSAGYWRANAEDTRTPWKLREAFLHMHHVRIANAIGWASR